ncbi:MAG: alpha-L-fucosidase [Crocinitomicaceae bacterium]
MKKWGFLLFMVLFGKTSFAQQVEHSDSIQWFSDAKLGIFIHWGIYAVDGTSESWAFHNKGVPYPTYMSQLAGFKAENYHPEEWAKLIKESGAQYTVMTTQHHDGVALWDTKFTTPRTTEVELKKALPTVVQSKYSRNFLWNEKLPLSVVYQTPAKQDLMHPFVDAVRKEGLKFGAYYSLLDWSHDDYPTFLKDYNRYQIKDDSVRWNRFLSFMHGQILEINQQFKPDLYWFDGDWEHSESEWQAAKIDQIIHQTNPTAILNGRLKSYGDYDTPEQNMPIVHPDRNTWELCLTSNDNWGYRPTDHNMKTVNEVLQIFTECLGMGGNLLLDIGPKADGTIPSEQMDLLKALGRWTTKHKEAIYGTKAGLPAGHFHGNSTISSDSMAIYLFLPAIGMDTTNQATRELNYGTISTSPVSTSNLKVNVQLKGLMSDIESITVLGTNSTVPFKIVGKIDWSYVPGTIYMNVPISSLDPEVSVIKIQLKNPVKLYRGKGGFH